MMKEEDMRRPFDDRASGTGVASFSMNRAGDGIKDPRKRQALPAPALLIEKKEKNMADFMNKDGIDFGAPIERAEIKLTTKDGHTLALDLSWPDFYASAVSYQRGSLMIHQLLVRSSRLTTSTSSSDHEEGEEHDGERLIMAEEKT